MKISTLSSRARRARILPLFAVALLAGAGEAAAISRYNSNGLTCEAARETVRAEGAVIFRHPSKRVPGMTLYDRYVRGGSYCNVHEVPARASVPTSDRANCPMLVCRPYDPDEIIVPPRL